MMKIFITILFSLLFSTISFSQKGDFTLGLDYSQNNENYIYGYDKDKLEQVVGKLLAKKNASLSLAESCTGGNLAHMITSVSGSSSYFKGSIVAYSNTVKTDFLSVDSQLLIKHGAVSKQVVEQMAIGANLRFDTDYSIATSGVAGPNGGSVNKPVGLVFIGIKIGKKVIVNKFNFKNNGRLFIQKQTVKKSLNLLLKLII